MKEKLLGSFVKLYPRKETSEQGSGIVEGARVWSCPGETVFLGEHLAEAGSPSLRFALPFRSWAVAAPAAHGKWRLYFLPEKKGGVVSVDPGPDQPEWLRRIGSALLHLAPGGADLLLHTLVPPSRGWNRTGSLTVVALSAAASALGIGISEEAWSALCADPAVALHYESALALRHAKADHLVVADGDLRRQRALPLDLGRYGLWLLDGANERQGTADLLAERRLVVGKALRKIQTRFPKVKKMAEMSMADHDACRDILDDLEYQRTRHLVTETWRVKQAVPKIRVQDFFTLGRFLLDSHLSLKNDYNATSRESDILVSFGKATPGVLGLKMSGPGPGGGAFALMERDVAEKALGALAASYQKETGSSLVATELRPADGLGEA